MTASGNTALIVVDVQRAFDEWEARGKRRNNPEAVARIVDLLAAFRDKRAPIFHIRHEGTRPTSSFLPGGHQVRRDLWRDHQSLRRDHDAHGRQSRLRYPPRARRHLDV